MENKICKTCKILKNLDKFNKQKEKEDGLKVICKDCQSNQRKQYTQRLKESGEYFWMRRVHAVNDLRTRSKDISSLKEKKHRTICL